jgi:acyl-CoA reductase-like NAD-dependent aldehyde dehydrogenase
LNNYQNTMEKHEIYLAGRFVKTSRELEVRSPYDNRLTGSTYLAGENELEMAIQAGLSAENEMKLLPSYRRYQILQHIASAIMADRQQLAERLSDESAKPMKYALGEIDRAAQTFVVAAEESKRLPGEYLSIDWTPSGAGKEAWVRWFPIGLMAGIAPFNFPLNLAVHKLAPAIAAGNPIILKPARSTPLSVLELARIIHQTDLPAGAVSILPMDRVAGNQLVTDERFKMLSFTGSPQVGWKMKRDAGKKRVVLELGGNAGVIITPTADIELAVNKCLMGGFSYSGQVCIHVQRIFVHETCFDQFTSQFAAKIRTLRQGDPRDPETDISAMIDQENAIRVEEWVNESVSGGAKIICGGKRDGSIFEPTLITRTSPDMKVCALEVFGPVVTVEKYSNFTEALRMVNDSAYGLQAGVFTNRLDEMNLAFNDLEVGGVIINDVPTFRVDHMPYGGVKESGSGREGISYAIREMMEPRILVKPVW